MLSFTNNLEAIMAAFLRKRQGFALGIVIAATTGCNTCNTILGDELNPAFCRVHLDDLECRQTYPDAAPDGPKLCTGDPDCIAPTGVCDPGAKLCVQCTAGEPGACKGLTPVCATDDVCRGCQSDDECIASQVCDAPSGSCVDEATVWYVSPTGTGNTCTHVQPCGQLTMAIGLVVPTKNTIKVLPGNYTEKVTITNKAVTIHGEGADLTEMSGSEILHVEGSADVSLLGLRIHGGKGIAGDGILCIHAGANNPTLRLQHVAIDTNGGAGLDATNCVLVVAQSTLSSNAGGGISATGTTMTVSQSTVNENAGGGISVSGIGAEFDITNTFVFRNGDVSASTFGGLNLGIALAGSNRLAFNTIVDNEANINSGGIICNAGTFMAPNNIIARNTLAGDATAPTAQTSGACTYPTSKIQNDVSGLAFQQSEAPVFSYKLSAGSSAIDQATTAVPIDVDNEGDHRPQGLQKDIGADEFKQ